MLERALAHARVGGPEVDSPLDCLVFCSSSISVGPSLLAVLRFAGRGSDALAQQHI